jgi:hypothetical protein
VVPLVLSRERAIEQMRQWLGRGFWRPGDLSERAKLVDLKAVYVPYWVFQARTHTYWTADTSRTPPGARGDWFPMTGEHHGSYAGILVGASGVLTPAETSAICPYDLSAAVAPEQVDLNEITVEQFGAGRKYARPYARAGIEQLEAEACRAQYVPGRSRNVKVNTRVEGLSSEPVLLPVWIMAYRYNDRLFRFLANGQTGRSTGEAPTSWRKMAVAIAAALLAIVLIFVLVSAAAGAATSRINSASRGRSSHRAECVTRVVHDGMMKGNRRGELPRRGGRVVVVPRFQARASERAAISREICSSLCVSRVRCGSFTCPTAHGEIESMHRRR